MRNLALIAFAAFGLLKLLEDNETKKAKKKKKKNLSHSKRKPVYKRPLSRRKRMTDPRVFISFDFDHNETEKNLFVGQSKNSKTPFSIQDWSAKSSMSQSEWEKKVNDKINKCNMTIALVGKTMASASGVAKEISMSKKNNVPIFGVYIDGANSNSNLPSGLARNRVITWNWDNIAAAVDQMMGEGKNKS